MEKITLNGIEMNLIVGRKAAWAAIQAAGITVIETATGKRAVDPKSIDGGYVSLTLAYDSRGAYPECKYTGKVTGSFAAQIRDIVANLIAKAV